jgi:hypothetical protein
MLTIKNLEKIIKAPGCSVQIKQVEMTDRNHPQRTYDMVFEHRDYPNKEFFLTIDREGQQHAYNGDLEYPISIWELTGPANQSKDLTIWESNLKTSTLFLDFLDGLTHAHINY